MMTATNLATRLIDECGSKRRRILVIGDAMTDYWVHGRLADCQDGCHKFVEVERCQTPGGAANAANCLTHWPVEVSLYGQSGIDRPQKWRFIRVRDSWDRGDIVFRYDNEPIVEFTRYKWAREQALEMVAHAAGVLLSDYDKGFLVPEFIREVADLCQRRGVPCVADAKRAPEVYAGCALKCNYDWFTRHGPICDIVTRGQLRPLVKGIHFMCDNAGLPDVKCVNHVGAGDCFAAHLTLALACGMSLRDAAAVAHSAGRVYVQHPHNRAPYPDEVAADMATATAPAPRDIGAGAAS